MNLKSPCKINDAVPRSPMGITVVSVVCRLSFVAIVSHETLKTKTPKPKTQRNLESKVGINTNRKEKSREYSDQALKQIQYSNLRFEKGGSERR